MLYIKFNNRVIHKHMLIWNELDMPLSFRRNKQNANINKIIAIFNCHKNNQ